MIKPASTSSVFRTFIGVVVRGTGNQRRLRTGHRRLAACLRLDHVDPRRHRAVRLAARAPSSAASGSPSPSTSSAHSPPSPRAGSPRPAVASRPLSAIPGRLVVTLKAYLMPLGKTTRGPDRPRLHGASCRAGPASSLPSPWPRWSPASPSTPWATTRPVQHRQPGRVRRQHDDLARSAPRRRPGLRHRGPRRHHRAALRAIQPREPASPCSTSRPRADARTRRAASSTPTSSTSTAPSCRWACRRWRHRWRVAALHGHGQHDQGAADEAWPSGSGPFGSAPRRPVHRCQRVARRRHRLGPSPRASGRSGSPSSAVTGSR